MGTKHRRWMPLGLLLTMIAIRPGLGAAQVELDRIVSRVDGRIITQSDVRQARALHLVAHAESDDAARRDLENRLLILAELSRGAGAPVTDADLDAGRRRWDASVPAGADRARLLSQAGMTEADLQAWIRDDVRVRLYVARQFAGLPDADREPATALWLSRLRQRAGLD